MPRSATMHDDMPGVRKAVAGLAVELPQMRHTLMSTRNGALLPFSKLR